MSQLLRTTVLITLVGTLVGCASNLYKEPKASSPHAAIYGEPDDDEWRRSLGHTETGLVVINGKDVDYNWSLPGAKRLIPPGNTSVTVQSYFSNSLTALGSFTFFAEAGKSYQVRDEDKGDHILFTLVEDQSGKVIAEARGRKVVKYKPRTLYVPIVY